MKKIETVLPSEYDEKTIVELLKKYYPHEWKSVECKKWYYDKKDKSIVKRKGKPRYHMPDAERLLRENFKFKKMCSSQQQQIHALNFNELEAEKNTISLWNERSKKIARIDVKIEKAEAKTMVVTPAFLEQLMGLYSRKNATQKDKIYIIHELKKYYNPTVISFFFKLNDTELNKQLREIAFRHLQEFNYQHRLRKQKYIAVHAGNKKRKDYLKYEYPNETYEIPYNPDELEYRILNGKEQKIMKFDYFISHSSKDGKLVQKLASYENSIGKLAFCDWIDDKDYLKRNLMCEATLKVIEWRLKQSDAVIFVRTSNSLNLIWCKYELNYFKELKKPIYCIDGEQLETADFHLEEFDVKTADLFDENYKKLKIDYSADPGV